jgi:putative transcriptional regulator
VIRLAILLLVLAFAVPANGADEAPQAILLVARKDLPDPFFRESVVLVTNAAVAPLGVIINKPTDAKLSKAIPDIERLKSVDDRLFFGGPVQSGDVVFVFRARKAQEDAMLVMPGIYISGSRDILDTLLKRDKPVEGLRLFAGHAGWSPGQLEHEISRGDWFLVPVDDAAIFTARPEGLWKELHRRAAATRVRWTP